MSDCHPFFQFPITARAYLDRAAGNLDRFRNDESVEHFFYAALELRFGIEARLNEYLRPVLRKMGEDGSDITEYVGTKLLRRLVALAPKADTPATLRITSNLSGQSSIHRFTPVSPRLASIHGRLGEVLHYQFFNMNERWYLRSSSEDQTFHTLQDYARLLDEGISELRAATSGNLLTNPEFTALVAEEVNGPDLPSEA